MEGFKTWFTGFNELVEMMVILDGRGELELETMNEASKACSECWGICGQFKGMGYGKEGVRVIAKKLKKMLDENGQTYKGVAIYSG